MTAPSDVGSRAAGAPPTSGPGVVASSVTRRSRAVSRVPRRYGQWAATVLFVLVTALAAGWLWQQKSSRQEVLAAANEVAAGTVIDRGDVTVVEVAGVQDTLSVADLDAVVGSTATVGLVPGQVLSTAMLTRVPVPGPGQRVVGVELDATRTPGGLTPGDVVVILAVPPAGDPSTSRELESPSVLAREVDVLSAVRVEGAGTRLTLLVAEQQANRVAAFGAAGRVAVVQAPTAESGGGG